MMLNLIMYGASLCFGEYGVYVRSFLVVCVCMFVLMWKWLLVFMVGVNSVVCVGGMLFVFVLCVGLVCDGV